MASVSGVEIRIGFEDGEAKEFLKAIRQPLMVQTPLQLVVENLFNRIQSQAAFMMQMKEKMERIAVKDVSADELLDRIKLLEAKQDEASGGKLNPFQQQEILSRLEALEAKLSDPNAGHDTGAPSPEAVTDLDARMSRLEARMTGVYNLNGKLVALEQVATGMGIPIPDLEYPTGGGLSLQQQGGNPPPGAMQGWRPPSHEGEHASGMWQPGRAGSPNAQAPDGSSGLGAGPRSTSPFHSPRSTSTALAPGAGTSHSRLGSAAAGPIGLTGGAAAQRLVAGLGAEVAAVRGENEALKEAVDRLGQQVAGLKTGLGSNATESFSRLQQVEEAVAALQAQVADLAAAARRDGGKQPAEPVVSFADFALLRSQVDAAVSDARQHAAAAAAALEKELPALASRVEEVADGVKKGGEPRDMDTLFHERINGLEAAMGDLKTELHGTLEAALEGAAKLEELQAIEEVLEHKAPLEAVRALQQQAVALGQAVAGMSEALSTRPELADALRSSAGHLAAGSPALTKMRCLTCDQPVQMPTVRDGSARKGSFLPRLDSMPAKDGPPGGPGVNVAELRASKEDRLAGLSVGGIGGGTGGVPRSLRPGELEEYANGTGGAGRDASPGRAMERARAARVAVGGQGKPSGAPHKPVFL